LQISLGLGNIVINKLTENLIDIPNGATGLGEHAAP